jgi:hypothetical protein
MVKTCIICGGRAGSHEHVFPAGLGGRRTNKGIFCGPHNQGFSPLATILIGQLKAINALLGIRPDHSDDPTAFEFVGKDGAEYALSGDKIEFAKPHIAEQSETSTTLQFRDQKQFEDWFAEQRAAGNKIKVNWRGEQWRYSTDHIPIHLSLGGTDGLRAAGYVALTFLAHHFPNQARQASLLPFKEFVQGTNPDLPVWWGDAKAMAGLPPNPFAFGHAIAIVVSGTRKEAYARISLFSTLNFIVDFGAVDAPSDRTVVVHIDPQSERPPDDIAEIKENTALFEFVRPSKSTLGDMIGSGQAQQTLANLVRRIREWQRETAAQAMLDKLNAIPNLSKDERDAQVRAIVAKQGQRLFLLMQFVINGLKPRFEAQARTVGFARLLERLIAADPNSANGLSSEATAALGVAEIVIAQEISNHLDAGDLTADRLSMLIGGGPGAALVGRAIIDPLVERLFSE